MIKIFQIYYNQEQLPQLEYTPFLNEECTVFFENSVIRKLIEENKHLGNEYFGVVSWKLRQKIHITKNAWRNHKNIANVSRQEFSPSHFEQTVLKRRPDAMSFQCHMPHDPVSFADKFHPHFSKFFAEIMRKAGYNWSPERFENVFYCNYFVAKSSWYEKYVKEMLAPAMDIMSEMPGLYINSKYPHTLPDHLVKEFGFNHYPYHAFLCERMFSYFVHIHKLKCLHY